MEEVETLTIKVSSKEVETILENEVTKKLTAGQSIPIRSLRSFAVERSRVVLVVQTSKSWQQTLKEFSVTTRLNRY